MSRNEFAAHVKRTQVHLLLLLASWLAAGTSFAQTTVEYIHTDALGSPVAVTNEAGQVIERFDYEPYGAIIGQPNYGGVGFTGHVQDAATGLTYMQQRYYDPQIGKNLSVDPVTALSNPVGMFNRYKYAANNPYKFIDPDGRCEKTTGSHICGGGAGNNVSVIQINPSSSSSNDTASVRQQSPSSQQSAVSGSPNTSDGNTSDSSIQDMPRIISVGYQGHYHDQLVAQLAEGMRASGALIATELPICLVGGGCARIDIFGRDPLGELFAMEVKTGLAPKFTPGQLAVYPHLSKSGTLTSPDPRISQFGYPPNIPLPAIRGVLLYQRDATSPPFVAPIP